MKELTSLDGGSAKKTASKPASKPTLKTAGKRDLRPLYAFGITLVLFVIAALLCQKYPFGEYSFLQSDLKAQYAPFLALLRNKIFDFASVPKDHIGSYLTYSFELGLGKNFMSSFGYYLASPFNLIYLFIDEAQIDAAVLLIVTLKMSLASSFMCLFIGHRIENKKSLWPILMGICYVFSLYAQAYLFQIMWLDGFMLLPLILYFTEKFIKEQKYLGLVISLLVLFVSNYYIAYMAGISCFLYLLVRMFVQKVQLKKAVGIAVRYVLTAGFTGLMTAVMLVPVGLDTIRNSDQTITDRGEELICYSPLTFVHMLLEGESAEFSDIMMGGYPFIFICLPVTILTLVYFLSPVFKGRERKAHALCLLGVLLSTILYPLDKAWQVFDDPNWFWHRQTFVFLPLFLIITVKVLLKLKEVARKDITKAMLVVIGLLLIDFSFGAMKGDGKAFLFNISLILAYSLLMMGFGIEKWPEQLHDMPKMLAPIMTGIIGFELVFVGPMLTSGIESMTLFGGPAAEYTESVRAVSEFGEYARKNNAATGAFRAEGEGAPEYTTKFYVEEGEAFYGHYNGLSFFNSNSNKKMQRFLKQLGMSTNYNYFAVGHSYACPTVDSFFSIDSLAVMRDLAFYRLDGEDSYDTGLKFYANESVLELGFAADKGAMDFDYYRLERDTTEKNYYALQNDWYRSLFPEAYTEDFFNEIDESVTGEPVITNGVFFDTGDYMTNEDFINKNDPELEEEKLVEDPLGYEGEVYYALQENLTKIYRANDKIPIAIEYNFKAPTTDELYCTIATGRILSGTNVYVNGILIDSFTSNAYYSKMIRLGSFAEGEDVKVTFLSEEGNWTYLNIRFASFDNEAFQNQFAKIDRSKVSVAEVYDGYAKFNISNLGSNEMVITTIPAEDGWKLYIDGELTDYETYQNAFIAFDPGQGSHTAELVFMAPGLKLGVAVTVIGVVGLAAFIVIDKNLSKKKKNDSDSGNV